MLSCSFGEHTCKGLKQEYAENRRFGDPFSQGKADSGTRYADFRVVLFAFAIIATTLGGLAAVTYNMRKAPEAYEDEQGFHYIRRARGSAILLRRKNARHSAEVGALKGARVHP